MKRLIALLTAGCLLFSAAAFAQESWADYRSDFSAGTDGWYARSAGTASISVTDGALLITGREAAWNSPGRDFDLIITLLPLQELLSRRLFPRSA